MNENKEQKDLCSDLALLNEEMKRHEWTPFGQKEADDLEKTKKEVGREACGPSETR